MLDIFLKPQSENCITFDVIHSYQNYRRLIVLNIIFVVIKLKKNS